MSGTTYYERNREVMLNRAKNIINITKNYLREKAKNKYRELSEEEKNINREYGRNRYHNIFWWFIIILLDIICLKRRNKD